MATFIIFRAASTAIMPQLVKAYCRAKGLPLEGLNDEEPVADDGEGGEGAAAGAADADFVPTHG
mgnify:CR=1 FL=1